MKCRVRTRISKLTNRQTDKHKYMFFCIAKHHPDLKIFKIKILSDKRFKTQRCYFDFQQSTLVSQIVITQWAPLRGLFVWQVPWMEDWYPGLDMYFMMGGTFSAFLYTLTVYLECLVCLQSTSNSSSNNTRDGRFISVHQV